MFKLLQDAFHFFFSKENKLDKTKLGFNAFYNQKLFSDDIDENMSLQSKEISKEAGIKTVRVLFHWSEHIQPSKGAKTNYGFLDKILENLEDDMKAIVVIAGAPKWLKDEFNPRQQLIQECLLPFIDRYKNNDKILGWQIGNEINTTMFEDNVVYHYNESSLRYIEVICAVYQKTKKECPDKLVISASTTSIIQNFPGTAEYTKKLLKHGLENYCDVVSIHYYGNNLWALFHPTKGALSILNSIKKPIFFTEIGTSELKEHLKYAMKYIPFFIKRIKNVDKIFWYQYDGGGSTNNYGLRTTEGIISPLLNHLKNDG